MIYIKCHLIFSKKTQKENFKMLRAASVTDVLRDNSILQDQESMIRLLWVLITNPDFPENEFLKME